MCIRDRPLPERRGEGGQPALPDGQEPLVQRRQQTHRGVPVPLVLGEQPHPLPPRRFAPFGQQHVGGPDVDDRREPHRGEGRDDEGGGESDK